MRKFLKFLLILLGLAVLLWFTVIIGTFFIEKNLGDFGIKDKIALIRIEGTIVTSEKIIKQLKKYDRDPDIKAIVLRIDSPGGGVAASQEIYDEVKKISSKGKIILSSLGSVAASGGYYIAVGTQEILANPGTITGSIGVIMLFPNAQELLKKIGLDTTVIKSGQYKDTGSFARAMTQEEEQLLQSVIDNVYGQFIQVVSTGRNLPPERVRELADGRIFTGEQAKELGLIDKLGNLEDTLNQAASLAGITGRLHIVEEKKERNILFRLLDEKLNSLFDLKNHISPYPPLQYLWIN